MSFNALLIFILVMIRILFFKKYVPLSKWDVTAEQALHIFLIQKCGIPECHLLWQDIATPATPWAKVPWVILALLAMLRIPRGHSALLHASVNRGSLLARLGCISQAESSLIYFPWKHVVHQRVCVSGACFYFLCNENTCLLINYLKFTHY